GGFNKVHHRKAGTEVEVVVTKDLAGHRLEPWKTAFVVRLPRNLTEAKYTFDADLRATRLLTLAATDNGAPVADATVKVNDKEVGKTDARGERGVFTFSHDGVPGKKVRLGLSAPGYVPAEWKTVVTLEGQVGVYRYFAPTTPRQIRVGVHRVSGNTLGADLRDVAAQTETAISEQLFKYPVFLEVPRAELEAEVKRAKLGIDRITTKGWQDTPLRKTVDMIVVGSVAKDDKGLVIETKLYTANGRLVLSQVTRARDTGG